MTGIPHLVNGFAANSFDTRDRGLQYGDGCFETMAVRNGRPLLWQAHLDRLRRGLERLTIDFPVSDGDLLRECESLSQGTERAVLKLIVTRGCGGRGYRPEPGLAATRVASLYPWPVHRARMFSEGMRLCLCYTRVSRNRRLGGIKHLNRLPQVLARGEWNDEYDEGLMLDESDRVIEGTMSNVFVELDGRLHTPRVDEAGVEGVMRNHVLAEARTLGYDCVEEDLDLDLLARADGMFLTNSILGVMPVASLDGRGLAQAASVRPLQEQIRNVVAV